MLSKKLMVAGSIILGVAILTTSAFADMIIGSGYTGLKEAFKNTVRTFEGNEKLDDNFTIEAGFSIKDGDQLYFSQLSVNKYDDVKYESKEEHYNIFNTRQKYERYYYSDDKMNVNDYGNDRGMVVYLHEKDETDSEKASASEVGYVASESADLGVIGGADGLTAVIVSEQSNPEPEDIFETDMAKDAEKVLDAFVGNLSGLVQFEESDGKKVYSGSIDSAQIPTYANALASFIIKYGLFDSYNYRETDDFPVITKDVYVSNVHAKAIECEEGYISNLHAIAEFCGTDKNDKAHTFTVDMYFSIYGVGETEIETPDISNAEIIDLTQETYDYDSMYDKLHAEDIGVYKKAVVIWNENNVRELESTRTFTIDSVDEDGNFTGTFTEEYKDGTESVTFSFSGNRGHEKDCLLGLFEYELNGNTMHGTITRYDESSLWISLNVSLDENGMISTYDNEEMVYNLVG